VHYVDCVFFTSSEIRFIPNSLCYLFINDSDILVKILNFIINHQTIIDSNLLNYNINDLKLFKFYSISSNFLRNKLFIALYIGAKHTEQEKNFFLLIILKDNNYIIDFKLYEINNIFAIWHYLYLLFINNKFDICFLCLKYSNTNYHMIPLILFCNESKTNINSKNEEIEVIRARACKWVLFFKYFNKFTTNVNDVKEEDNIYNNMRNNSKIFWLVESTNIDNNKYLFAPPPILDLKIDIINLIILRILISVLYNNNLNLIKIFYYNINNVENLRYRRIIKDLKEEWNDIKWIISFKFDLVFNNEHKYILLNYINEYIKDNKLILLLNSLLNKSIITMNYLKITSNLNLKVCHKLSNLLIDIFFHKLDKKINDLKIAFFKNYNKYNVTFPYVITYFNDAIISDNIRNNNTINFNLFNGNICIKYLRYYDSFIIGITGNKWQVNEIKNEIHFFLKFELFLKNVFSFIVDIHNDNFKFLNIILSNGIDTNSKHKILFLSSRYLIIKALINSGVLNKKGKPKAIKRLLKFNISSIISIYVNIHNLIINSFYYCQDYVSLFKLISSFIYCSLKLTLQVKLNYKNNANILKLLITLNLIDQNLLTCLSYLRINRNTRKLLKNKIYL